MAKTTKRENVKIKKKKGFTQVQNWAPDDMTLSDKALGLYTRIQRWITFEAPGFECTKAFMRSKTPSGEKAFDSAWNELKDRGYLKMYCIPPANWEAELLDEPQPDTPHTYYLNADGEVKSTNIDRAEKKKKALETASNKGSKYYPQKRGNTKSSNTKRGTTKSTNTKSTNKNGGKNIITSSNTSSNTFDKTYLSINHSEDPEDAAQQFKQKNDRWIDGAIKKVIDKNLIEDVQDQIEYDTLIKRYEKELVDTVVSCIADLYTVSEPQEFSGSVYAPEFIQRRSLEIDFGHVEYVFECFEQQRDKVYNIRKYLRSAIFNAPATISAYYTNKVKADGMVW